MLKEIKITWSESENGFQEEFLEIAKSSQISAFKATALSGWIVYDDTVNDSDEQCEKLIELMFNDVIKQFKELTVFNLIKQISN